jgi:hypothetical protein
VKPIVEGIINLLSWSTIISRDRRSPVTEISVSGRMGLKLPYLAPPVPASRQSCPVSSVTCYSESMLPTEVTTAELARLLGVSRRYLPDLAERKIIVPGSRKGTYAPEPSVSGNAKHLRRLAQGRQGTGETLSTAEGEALCAASSALSTIASSPSPTGSHTSARGRGWS